MAFTPSSLPSLTGKTYVVTGGNTGIGRYTVQHLAEHGARVYLGARSESKANAAITEIKQIVPSADINFLQIDLTDLKTVAVAAAEFKNKEIQLHGLVNNAGIMATPFEKTKDGYEAQWQTNYVSHWLLTYLLLPTLLSTAAAPGSKPGDVRIVNLTSNGHNFAPSAGIDFADIDLVKGGIWNRYGQSKLGNILHAKTLAKLYGPNGTSNEGKDIWTASVHPGSINTQLNKRTSSPLKMLQPVLQALGVYSTADEGSYSSLFAVASQDFKESDVGGYFVPTAKKGKPSKKAGNEKLAEELWSWSEKEMRSKGFIDA